MDDERRVELVGQAAPDGSRTQRLGIGLLVSLAIGFGPLRDAATGGGSFPLAVGRYLVCLACSLAAVLTLGRLLDGAPLPEPDPTDPAGAAAGDATAAATTGAATTGGSGVGGPGGPVGASGGTGGSGPGAAEVPSGS